MGGELMAWKPRTWADDHAGEPPPCECGRTVPADMLVNVSGVAALKRTDLPRARPQPSLQDAAGVPKYLCDGCRERIIRERGITRAEFAAAIGAPAAVVEKLEAR